MYVAFGVYDLGFQFWGFFGVFVIGVMSRVQAPSRLHCTALHNGRGEGHIWIHQKGVSDF